MKPPLRSRGLVVAFCAAALGSMALGAVPAQAEFDDPLFLFRPLRPPPEELPAVPPVGDFEGPCGLAVNSAANFFVSDYYHHTIDQFGAAKGYGGQITGVEPLDPSGEPVEKDDKPVDGPCQVAFGAGDALYVNIFHRSVVRFSSFPMEAKQGEVLTGAPLDGTHPTGVAADPVSGDVYVLDRDRILSFDSSGAPLATIGAEEIGDGYGLALSGFPGTAGRLYVPDASTNTVEVFDPAVSKINPVATIDGSATPKGRFVSLKDAAIAVDNSTGEIYVADNLNPVHTERPEAAIYVFSASGAYEGRLKYNIVDALPPGLAVDNSNSETQSRVYVTTENSERAAIFAYPPAAATSAALPAPPLPKRKTEGEEPEEELGGEEESTLSAASVQGAAATLATTAGPVGEDATAPRAKRAKRHPRHRGKGARRHGSNTANHQAKRGR